MKAIQVRYLGPTDTKVARLRAWTDAGSITESRDYDLDVDQQAKRLIKAYIADKWPHMLEAESSASASRYVEMVDISTVLGGYEIGFGTLPNGDWVGTIGGQH